LKGINIYKYPKDYDKEIRLGLNKTLQYYSFYDPNHPLSMVGGIVYYHRHVASIKIGRWLNKEEQVHHINENRLDNRPENLDILSPEEHTKVHHPINWDNSIIKCICCEKKFAPKKRTQKCCSKSCKASMPTKLFIEKHELEKLVWKMPTTEVAKIFGVSDKAIEKRCKKLGISKPPRGYWQKVERNGKTRNPEVDR